MKTAFIVTTIILLGVLNPVAIGEDKAIAEWELGLSTVLIDAYDLRKKKVVKVYIGDYRDTVCYNN